MVEIKKKTNTSDLFSAESGSDSAFYTVPGVLKARILERVAISSCSIQRFVRTLYCDLSVLGGSA